MGAVDWTTWTCRNAVSRAAGVRRWMLYAEQKYGSLLDYWPQRLNESIEHDHEDLTALLDTLTKARNQIANTRQAIVYLGRVMEGELPADDEILRDLYVQTHQMAAVLHSASCGLQQRLDHAIHIYL